MTLRSVASSDMKNHTSESSSRVHGSFWPLILVVLSVLVLMVWKVDLAIKQRASLLAKSAQLQVAVNQSKKIQDDLEKIATDLLELADEDEAAASVVGKYKIDRVSSADQ